MAASNSFALSAEPSCECLKFARGRDSNSATTHLAIVVVKAFEIHFDSEVRHVPWWLHPVIIIDLHLKLITKMLSTIVLSNTLHKETNEIAPLPWKHFSSCLREGVT
jgi:hypothetical protein